MNEFLKTRNQIDESTEWLKDNNYVTHPISAKDWELAIITESIGDGDTIEMGADGSRVLHNVIIKGVKGEKVGIDLSEVTGDNKAEGAVYFKGDLMATPFEDNSFDTVISQSVIEHEVDLSKFAKEVSRLLRNDGKLIVSFDYAPEKIDTSITKLYSLAWNILSPQDVIFLVGKCEECGLRLSAEIDWETKDMVITPQYCSPANCSYTFGILMFLKTSKPNE